MRPRPVASLSAVTLLEVTIATALFGGMMLVVMEAMVYMRGLAATVEDIDIMEREAAKARNAITRDFANSGWFYCLPGANGRKFYPQIHISQLRTWQRSELVSTPSVTIPIFNEVTRTTNLETKTATVSQNRATIFGDAIVFTRLQPEGQPLSDTPVSGGAAIVDFSRAQPMRLDQFANARAIQGLVINPSATGQQELTSVVWETTPAMLTRTPPMKAEEFYKDTNVRLFCYRVVPDRVTGRGELVRFYSNPDSGDRNSDDAWVVDEVIAQDVVAMRIYSFEMASWYSGTDTSRDFTVNDAAGLTNNQIRFSIDFARNLEQIDPATRIEIRDRRNTSETINRERASTVKTLQFTVGLRSITNALDQ